MTCESTVTKKGQITIPIKIRKKFNLEESSRVQIIEKAGEIVIKKCPTIFELGGSGAGKGKVEELKTLLDQMRAEDA
jgi:AbrB family looped-hinge helix DNA binding protein